MNEVFVHPRVMERHPHLSEEDVVHAWNNNICMQHRMGESSQVIAVGFDVSGRVVEMIAKESAGDYLIYHALEPVTKAILQELGLMGGRK